MDQAKFEILDRAVRAGGANLSAQAIGGKDKEGKAALARLCDDNYLKKTRTKYSLTPEGREEWLRLAPPERLREVRDAEEQAQREALAAFLLTADKKSGKPLTAAEQKKFSQATLKDAQEQRLVERGEKAHTYRVLPAGRTLLLSRQPLEEQIAVLQTAHQDILGRWSAAQQHLQEDLDGLGADGPERPALDDAAAAFRDKVAGAQVIFDAALGELRAFSGFLAAARQLKESLSAAASEAERCLREQSALWKTTEASAREQADRIRAETEAFRQEYAQTVEAMKRHLAATQRDGPSDGARQQSPSGQPVTEEAAWEVVRRSFERLKSAAQKVGGVVKVPELTDNVVRSLSGLSAQRVHELLLRWQDEDRLTLKVCNDPRLEDRASEGISSPRGLLFYLVLH